jgi:hypothetical protein
MAGGHGESIESEELVAVLETRKWSRPNAGGSSNSAAAWNSSPPENQRTFSGVDLALETEARSHERKTVPSGASLAAETFAT